jgi:primosomal protein N' (replication factor Y)
MCDNCDATMVVHRNRAANPLAPENPIENRKSKIENALAASINSKKKEHHSPPLTGTVQCHYCLTANLLPQLCPLCQARLTHLGQGTQRAEDELLRKFPSLGGGRLQRMDSDSMTNLGEYQRSLDAFGRGEIDLLIGTQMISKGLDFPNVSLVGVLNSDLAMTIPDFRASERTFQLICQVAGRSGRSMGGAQGTVIVQTFQPQEPAIAYACRHDYFGFVQSELPNRKEFGYPPYGRLVRIVMSHKSYAKVHAAADELMRLITALTAKLSLPVRVTGPLPPPMERVNELYRVELVMFSDSALPLQRLLGSLRARGALQSGRAGGVTIAVDVDPLHML